jgi:hypothetical protein
MSYPGQADEPSGNGRGGEFLFMLFLAIAITAFWYGWQDSVPIVIGILAGSLIVNLFGLLRRHLFGLCVLLYIGWVLYGYLSPYL